MRIIGLTGGTGSGKGVVSSVLSKKGAKIIDSDLIAHDVILKGKPAYNEIVNYFGKEILNETGEIVRKKLGSIVFSTGKEKLEFLNKCTHKYIYSEIYEQIKKFEEEGQECVVIDAPLLLEGDFKNLCNEIWVVYADENIRLKRIMTRDNLNEKDGISRISSQKPWEEYKRFADVIIINNGSLEEVEKQVEEFY